MTDEQGLTRAQAADTGRSGAFSKIAAAGLFVLLFGFALAANARYTSVRALDVPPEMHLSATAENVKVPTGLREGLVERLSSQPLNQSQFNTFYVTELRRGVDDKQRDKLIATLAELGWRNTSGQRNLILDAVRRQHLETAVLRADGLLRREKMTEELLPVMRTMEQDPDAAKLLVSRLSKQPDWRIDYFRSIDALSQPAARAARLALLNAMLDAKEPLTRTEMKRSLDAMVAAGEAEGAVALVDRLVKPATAGSLNRDPDFRYFASLSAEDRRTPLPTEWDLASKEGLSAKVSRDDKASKLVIRWNGQGAPLIARQLVKLGSRTDFRLAVSVPTTYLGAQLRRISFKLACPGQMPATFKPVDEGQDSLSVNYVVSGAPSCEYGYLAITGQPMVVDRRVNVQISSLTLTPA